MLQHGFGLPANFVGSIRGIRCCPQLVLLTKGRQFFGVNPERLWVGGDRRDCVAENIEPFA